jgi:hypothetical protein
MLILNDRIQKTAKVMDKINVETSSRNSQDREDTRLSAELRRMQREGDSVKRTGNLMKIKAFNDAYFKKLSRLSVIRQKTGSMNRDDVVRETKKWKEKN